MKNLKHLLLLCLFVSGVQSCGVYSLSGVKLPSGATTFHVNFFQNEAAIVEPGIDRRFTRALEDRIQDLSTLSITSGNADLLYEGEIVEYYVAPQSSTSDNTAAQNRLTITVNVRFYNNLRDDGEDDFERRYSFFVDVPASQLFTGSTLDTALEEIYERITQDIFNDSLANW